MVVAAHLFADLTRRREGVRIGRFNGRRRAVKRFANLVVKPERAMRRVFATICKLLLVGELGA